MARKKKPEIIELLNELPVTFSFHVAVENLLSENSLYTPTVGKRGSRYYAYMRLSDKGRVYKKDLESKVDAIIPKKLKDLCKKLSKAKIPISANTSYKFYVTKSTLISKTETLKKKMDVTNLVKGTEDSIFKVLGLDDSIVLNSLEQKIPVDSETFKPVIFFEIEISELAKDVVVSESEVGKLGYYAR